MPESTDPKFDRRFVRPKYVAIAVLLAALGYGAFSLLRPDVASLVQNAKTQFDRGEYCHSLELADRVLARELDNPSALVIGGDACFAMREYDRALSYYRRVPAGPAKNAVHAQLRCGRIKMHHVGDAVAAEAHFRTGLRYVPDDRNALFQLAGLLGIEARRSEAVPVILRLFRQGQFNRDFLALMESENTALYNIEELHRYRDASPDGPAVLVGLAWHARQSGDDEKALQLLNRAVDRDPRFVEARVALASLLWDSRQFEQLRILLNEQRSREIDDPRFWIIRARLAEHNDQSNAAIRCFWEALRRDQTNRIATYKLFRFLSQSKDRKAAEAFRRRIEELQTLRERTDFVISKQHPRLTPVRRLVEQLDRVGRLWEAWGWCVVALEINPNVQWAAERAESLRLLLKEAPLTLVCRPATSLKLDLSSLPLPNWESELAKTEASSQRSRSDVTFRDDAQSAGLVFQYFNCPSTAEDGRRMYEVNGGGCAVLDYDSDGWPDLYFTQGCHWPVRDDRSDHIDRLFRNLGDGRFADVTSEAGLSENRFSTGVAVGDFDNDGFDDLYIANIGRNRLFHNNGDGTFRDVTEAASVGDPRWSTSCVMADLNGDSLPDIYSVNYLTGPSIFETICEHKDGWRRMCMPFDFSAAQDKLYVNLGDGRFANATEESGIRVPNGKGLGVVAADWEGNGRVGLFVTNDTATNFFFVNQGSQPDGTPRFEERGMAAGIALNREGRAEGCMGIALGDADEDGDLDLFITNFYRETNTLYRSMSALTFDDTTRESGLAEPSIALLGFGTQFLDADLDGRLDLLVTNGHIDDYRRYGRPYKMPPQFYRNLGGGRFSVQPAIRVGPHFSRELLGRGLARVDWNRDGREDAVISHLDQPAALLTNTTERCGRHLSIRLRGVRSSRDAVGTTVVVHAENRTITRQLTAGDGYQANNERLLVFGLSSLKNVQRLDVKWPSGARESFHRLDTDSEYLFVEGAGRVFRIR